MEEKNYLMVTPDLLVRMFLMSAFITSNGKIIVLSNNECFRGDDELIVKECSYQPILGAIKFVFNEPVTEPMFTFFDGRTKGIEDC